MEPFVISVDSTADLYAAYAAEHGISVAALTYTVEKDGQLSEYKDAFTEYAQYVDFFMQLRAGAFSRTSMLNFDRHFAHFENIVRGGAHEVLHFSLSGGLSPTANVAAEAAKAVEQTYPGCKIYVIDSLGATAGTATLVRTAVRLRDEGASAQLAASELLALRLRVQYVIIANDLYYLKRGGRVSAVAAVAGSLLQVKPVLTFTRAGKLAVVEKCRGMKKAFAYALERLKEVPPDDHYREIGIVHTDAQKDAEELAGMVEATVGYRPVVTIMGPVIGSHLGPGAVGMGWISVDERRG